MHGESEIVLLEDVQDAVGDLVEILQTHQSKHKMLRVFLFTLCKKRQEEAEATIHVAMQRLQVQTVVFSCLHKQLNTQSMISALHMAGRDEPRVASAHLLNGLLPSPYTLHYSVVSL